MSCLGARAARCSNSSCAMFCISVGAGGAAPEVLAGALVSATESVPGRAGDLEGTRRSLRVPMALQRSAPSRAHWLADGSARRGGRGPAGSIRRQAAAALPVGGLGTSLPESRARGELWRPRWILGSSATVTSELPEHRSLEAWAAEPSQVTAAEPTMLGRCDVALVALAAPEHSGFTAPAAHAPQPATRRGLDREVMRCPGTHSNANS